MKLIVCTSRNWGIGKDNSLLFSLPTDMKFFRETTKGKTVIMGRKTLESFPNGKPLKNRRNIVFSSKQLNVEGIEVVGSVEELLSLLGDEADDAFVIGGESIYKLLLENCDTAYVTRVKDSAPADTYFPNLDEDPCWALKEQSEIITENDIEFTFCTYKREWTI